MCREYAPASSSGAVASESSGFAVSVPVAQFLVPEEQLLFYSELAEIKEHWGKATQAAVSFGNTARAQQQGSGSKQTKPQIKTGELAITDRRIFLVHMRGGFLSESQAKREFDVIFDADYAKQRIELAKAKNEEIKQQAKGVSVFSRGKFMMKQGFETMVRVVIGASLEKAVMGQEYIKLKIYCIRIGGKHPVIGFLESVPGINLSKQEWELRVKRPLNVATQLAGVALTLTTGWFGPILMHYKSKADVTYQPILEIFQAKALELSALCKELEAVSAK